MSLMQVVGKNKKEKKWALKEFVGGPSSTPFSPVTVELMMGTYGPEQDLQHYRSSNLANAVTSS